MPKMFQVIPTAAEDQEGVPHSEARAGDVDLHSRASCGAS